MDREVGGHTLLIGRAQHPGDAPRRLLDPAGVIEYFGDDDIAVFGAPRLAAGDQDTMRDSRIVRHDDADAPFAYVLSGNLARAAFQHLDQLAFRLAAAVATDDFDGNPIAVEQRAHLASGEINVFVLPVVTDDEAETVTMAADLAGDEVELFRQAVFAAPVFDELAGADHFVEPVREQG